MFGKTLVEKCIRCRNKQRRTLISLHKISKEHLSFFDDRIMQQDILASVMNPLEVLRKKIAVRRGCVNLSQVQPLRKEVVNKRLELW